MVQKKKFGDYVIVNKNTGVFQFTGFLFVD